MDKKLGDYECPIFSFSKKEKNRIRRPWRNAMIVKLDHEEQ